MKEKKKTNGSGERVRARRDREIEKGKKISLLSKFYGNRTVGFYQSRRQS